MSRGGIRAARPVFDGHPRVSVVIPTLNEARNLPYVAERFPKRGIDEVILVDGHSTDGTVEVARALWPDLKVVQQTRKGKGNALACGFEAATGDIIVMIDADCSTDPAEIPAFVGALLAGAGYAKGTRFCLGGGSADITRWRRAGNYGLNALVNTVFGSGFTDLCYGYNAFWRDCLPVMQLPDTTCQEAQWGDGFEIETLINTRVARSGVKISEVASFEDERLFGESNLSATRDGLRVLRTIFHERFTPTGPVGTTVGSTGPTVGSQPTARTRPTVRIRRTVRSGPAWRTVRYSFRGVERSPSVVTRAGEASLAGSGPPRDR